MNIEQEVLNLCERMDLIEHQMPRQWAAGVEGQALRERIDLIEHQMHRHVVAGVEVEAPHVIGHVGTVAWAEFERMRLRYDERGQHIANLKDQAGQLTRQIEKLRAALASEHETRAQYAIECRQLREGRNTERNMRLAVEREREAAREELAEVRRKMAKALYGSVSPPPPGNVAKAMYEGHGTQGPTPTPPAGLMAPPSPPTVPTVQPAPPWASGHGKG